MLGRQPAGCSKLPWLAARRLLCYASSDFVRHWQDPRGSNRPRLPGGHLHRMTIHNDEDVLWHIVSSEDPSTTAVAHMPRPCVAEDMPPDWIRDKRMYSGLAAEHNMTKPFVSAATVWRWYKRGLPTKKAGRQC